MSKGSAAQRAILSIYLVYLSACTKIETIEPPTVRNIDEIFIEVDYQTGAKPEVVTEFVPGSGITDNAWEVVTRPNIEALTNVPAIGRTLNVIVPSSDADLQELDASKISAGGDNVGFNSGILLDIAERFRDVRDSGRRASLYVLFVNGLFVDESGAFRSETLGVSIGNTGVVALFAPVLRQQVNNSNQQNLVTKWFVEQSTVVHELGHAGGLVGPAVIEPESGFGLPLQSNHLDNPPNKTHCTNQRCVMYFQNQGSRAALQFYARVVNDRSVVMFGQECIDDAHAGIRCAMGQAEVSDNCDNTIVPQ